MKWHRRLAPPTALLARVRWLFLGFWYCFWAALAVHIAVSRPPGIGAIGIGAMVALAAWWTRCARRSRFPIRALPIELPLLLAIGLAMPDPLELVYSIIPFRAVYARRRRELVVTNAVVVAVTVVVSGFNPWALQPTSVTAEVNSIVGTIGFSVILYFAIRAMAAAERAASRERTLADAALDFGAATERDEVLAALVASGRTLVTDGVEEELDDAAISARMEAVDGSGGDGAPVDGGARPTSSDPASTSVEIDLGDGDQRMLVVDGGDHDLHREARDSIRTLARGASLAFQRLALQRTLEHQAARDPLTGAANRRLFMTRLADMLARAEIERRPPAVLFIDVDRFKAINDARGHDVGDAVLIAFADRMRSSLGADDLVARFGGDEFAVLLADRSAGGGRPDPDTGGRPDVDVEVGASMDTIVARLEAELARPIEVVPGPAVLASASIGAARWQPGMSVTDLIRDADAAMYKAKRADRLAGPPPATTTITD